LIGLLRDYDYAGSVPSNAQLVPSSFATFYASRRGGRRWGKFFVVTVFWRSLASSLVKVVTVGSIHVAL